MADFYRVTPPQLDRLPAADDSVAASAVSISAYGNATRVSAFETTKFSDFGITTQEGGAIVGRDIRDTDLITIDGVQMQIGAARHLGLVSPDRQ